MKAFAIKEYSKDPKALQQVEIPKPEPESRDLLVKIHAVALNPADYKVRSNFGDVSVKLEQPRVLGWDASGVVESVGKDVTKFKVGDEVMFSGSLSRAGCNAEYCLVDERITGKKPKTLTFEQAASLPLTGLTAWESLEGMGLEEGKTYSDKTILVFAGAGGVGSLVIPLAKKLFGLKVIATASRTESQEAVKKFGADLVINHKKDLQEELKRVGLNGVDYIYNCYSDDEETFNRFVPIINPEGKICLINGAPVPLNLGGLFFKKVSIFVENMMARPAFGVNMEKQGEILNGLADLVEKGELDASARVSKHFPSMSHLPEAHALQESQQTIGKIVLTAKFD